MIKRQNITTFIAIALFLAAGVVNASTTSCSMLGRQWSARHVTETNTWNRRTFSTSSRRRNQSPPSPNNNNDDGDDNKSLLLAWGKKKTSTETTTTTPSSSKPVTEMEEGSENQPSLAEMRAQLGPVGRTIASGVEIGIITGGSYISGGFLGYFLGGILGTPTLFRAAPVVKEEAMKKTFSSELKGRMGSWHTKAAKQAKTWAELSAAFSGFHALTRTLRGGKEDKWNNILGSAATGAYLTRQGGPQSMIQGAATYAGFTYILDQFFGTSYNKGPNNNTGSTDEFDFKDAPVEERGF